MPRFRVPSPGTGTGDVSQGLPPVMLMQASLASRSPRALMGLVRGAARAVLIKAAVAGASGGAAAAEGGAGHVFSSAVAALSKADLGTAQPEEGGMASAEGQESVTFVCGTQMTPGSGAVFDSHPESQPVDGVETEVRGAASATRVECVAIQSVIRRVCVSVDTLSVMPRGINRTYG